MLTLKFSLSPLYVPSFIWGFFIRYPGLEIPEPHQWTIPIDALLISVQTTPYRWHPPDFRKQSFPSPLKYASLFQTTRLNASRRHSFDRFSLQEDCWYLPLLQHK